MTRSQPSEYPWQRARRLMHWLAGYEGVPYLARHSFRYEFLGVFTFAIAAAAMEGNFAQFFAHRTFRATGWVVAAISAAGALGNLTAAITAPLLRHRRQVPLMVLRMAACGALLGIVALLPAHPASAPWFAVIMLAMASLNSTATNAQTTLWQSNYPTSLRGQIISRFIMVSMVLVMVLVKLQSWALDSWGWFYRAQFLIAAAAALTTAALYSRVRIRGEQARLRRHGRLSEPAARAVRFNPLEVLGVLRDDRHFRRYMCWQMCLGSATMIVEPVLVLILAERFGADYSAAMWPLVVAPMLIRLLSTPLLGRLYDTMNIFVFRSTGAVCWGLGRMILFTGALWIHMPLLFAGRCVAGLGGSFGGLAWSLGHMNFAPADKSPLYMGAHMLLNGLRGAFVPFLGIWLYQHTPVGMHLLWISGLLHLLAAAGMWRMRDVILPDAPRQRPAPAVARQRVEQ